jgi:hypothetical protein
VVETQARVAVPEPGRLLGVIAPHVSPAGRLSVRLTVAVRWLRELIVIVDVSCWPVSAVVGGVAVMLKSWKSKIAMAVWTSGLLVAVIVTV